MIINKKQFDLGSANTIYDELIEYEYVHKHIHKINKNIHEYFLIETIAKDYMDDSVVLFIMEWNFWLGIKLE